MKQPEPLIPKRSLPKQVEEENEGGLANNVHLKNGC